MSFQFASVNILIKDFYKTKDILDVVDIYTIDVDKIVVSNPVECNKGRDNKYIIGYQTESCIIPLKVMTPKNVVCPRGVTQYNEGSKYEMGFDMDDHHEWLKQYKQIWEKIEEQTFQTLTKNPINQDRYINPKLDQYQGKINTSFNNLPPHNRKCEATALLRTSSVYQQGGVKFYPQTIVEVCRYKELLLIDYDKLFD